MSDSCGRACADQGAAFRLRAVTSGSVRLPAVTGVQVEYIGGIGDGRSEGTEGLKGGRAPRQTGDGSSALDPRWRLCTGNTLLIRDWSGRKSPELFSTKRTKPFRYTS